MPRIREIGRVLLNQPSIFEEERALIRSSGDRCFDFQNGNLGVIFWSWSISIFSRKVNLVEEDDAVAVLRVSRSWRLDQSGVRWH